MTDAVIVSACRTAIGTARKGSLADIDPFDLASLAVKEAVGRSGIDPLLIEDVLLAESLAGGGAIARHAAITASLTHVPGAAVNRHCASGLTTLNMAAASIRAGMDRAVVAGGVQSSSLTPVCNRRVPFTDGWTEGWLSPSHPPTHDAPADDMTITVGWNTAQRAGITREAMDEWALYSHLKAIDAIDHGRFASEIVPIPVRRSDGTDTLFSVDEHPRRGTSLEKLAALKVIHPEIEGFSITAGNSAGINDGAAALVVASSEMVESDRLESLAIVRAWSSVGVDPVETGLAPILAIPKALQRAGLEVSDVAVWEINEAFAAVPIAAVQALSIDPAKVNPCGSGCSLGHPIAMTGTRMITTLISELRRSGGGIGVAAMCAGGGMATATVIEV